MNAVDELWLKIRGDVQAMVDTAVAQTLAAAAQHEAIAVAQAISRERAECAAVAAAPLPESAYAGDPDVLAHKAQAAEHSSRIASAIRARGRADASKK